jgi:hypothetical protein
VSSANSAVETTVVDRAVLQTLTDISGRGRSCFSTCLMSFGARRKAQPSGFPQAQACFSTVAEVDLPTDK